MVETAEGEIPYEQLTPVQKSRRTAARNRLLRREKEDLRPCVIRCVCGETISETTLGEGREAFRRHRVRCKA